ncbi:alpha/beta hydrolase [Longimycelium tulufanense]|uniref:alpha/beta hydrolase n=1 Tax=Longimycelium tulufanense TaxID=907463 RepID=UPI0027E4EA03|nr:alpha/beta hydrolase-fold protein [Longimycelium tulufanense]
MSRRVVLGASGVLGAVVAGAALTSASVREVPRKIVRHAAGVAGAPVPQPRPVVRVEQVRSAARNREINLVTVYPDQLRAKDLPVCLMLHGRFGTARELANIPSALARAMRRPGARRFAFVAVDGGNSYWHRNRSKDDPMAMLLEEVPRWLAERGLGGRDRMPFAVAGVSMGGFGALLYARRRREQGRPLQAVAAVSPALMLSWKEMKKRDAFHDATDWAAMDPLRNIDKLGNVPLGVWCGSEDWFIAGNRRFIRAAKPKLASITPGGHTGEYFQRIYPQMVTFIGKHVPREK